MAGDIRIKNVGYNVKEIPAEIFVDVSPKFLLIQFFAQTNRFISISKLFSAALSKYNYLH